MKKFSNLDATNHNYDLDEQNAQQIKKEEDLVSNFASEVDSIMINHSDHMLEETTTHMMHVHNHKREIRNSYQKEDTPKNNKDTQINQKDETVPQQEAEQVEILAQKRNSICNRKYSL